MGCISIFFPFFAEFGSPLCQNLWGVGLWKEEDKGEACDAEEEVEPNNP